MDLKSIENGFYNQNLSIKKRFLISNTLFKKELKKIKNKLIKERIKIDSLRYITLIEYQNIHSYLKPYENKKDNIAKLIMHNNLIIDISIPKKIIIKLFLFQIKSLISWIKDKKRKFKINIFLLSSVAEDLLQHIYKKKRGHNLEIIIPVKLIIFSKKKIFKNIQLNSQREKITSLNFNLDKFYKIRESYYLKTELISKEISNFIVFLSKFKFINSIVCYSNHQSYFENLLSSQYKKISKKWHGVYIALHGGNYGISYGYPIMHYHCQDDLDESPNFLLPIELHNHFFEDINIFNKNLSSTLLNNRKILKKQYGFDVIKNFKNSKLINDDLFIFANNLVPYADTWINFYDEFHISKTIERWKKFRQAWKKGETYIVVRPVCKNHLMNFYKKEMDEIKIITSSNKYNLNNSFMIFEGQSSAIRELSRKSKFSLIYLPKRIFFLSKNNFIKQDLQFKKENIKIIEDEKILFKIIELVNSK